ncbi:erythromycin esterase family protein [Ornithinimicrobium murale]|uniref:erythromycin esterase family protein n=1 Tax=Ornithinimicrobium murale TaxID=1050153 RepID=UPI000E0CEA10|nr:erythromycin esterase family protein [Ornithinimicrobium murale]
MAHESADDRSPAADVDASLAAWVAQHAVAFPVDDATQPPPRVLSEATVVGLASAVRSARELVLATHALLRALVQDTDGGAPGVRAVSIEGTDAPFNTAADLDRWTVSGEGDLRTLLHASQGFLHNHEAEAVFRWLRHYAVTHPDDPVRIVHDRAPVGADPDDLAEIELDLARRNLDWQHRTGQRIAHWGGTAHTVAADERHLPAMPEQTHRNAGGHLRAALGTDYAAAVLTMGTGSVPFFVPPTPPDLTEAVLRYSDVPVLLALESDAAQSAIVRSWLRRPLRTRAIGPSYDPARDADAVVENGPVGESINAIVYVPTATAVSPLPG